MSELFKWLSKAEAERATSRPAGDFEAEFQTETAHDPPIPIEKANARAAIANPIEFDMELADYKIKAILDSGTLPGEQFRFLRVRLSLLQRQHGIKKLLITSSVPGEGKTFVGCCLAGILAQEPGKRVLFIDADLRMPRTAKELGLERGKELTGLSQVLQRTHTLKNSLLKLSGMDLYYLPPGAIPPNPSELLASDNLEPVIRSAMDLFDWIIIDSPPILNVADPIHIAPLCDAVLMVVQANKTPAKLIQKAIQIIGRNHICGIVLNRIQAARRSSRYYYQYCYSKDARGTQ